VFRDFNMKLDGFTHFALGVSRWLNNYWYVLVLFLVPCLLVDGSIFYLLHRSRHRRSWSYLWAAVLFLLILAFAGCMSAVLYMPFSKLLDDLSR
jgi:type II secretory pathway component PulF